MMSAKRTGLGRGLDALLGDSNALKPVEIRKDGGDGLSLISVDLLRRGTYQPRKHIDSDSLEELADSIRAQGLIQPIVVRPLAGRDASGARQYEIVAGERRWRAAQLAGMESVPAIVRDISDSEAIAVALIENIQREDLALLEEAEAVRRLMDEFDLTHEAAGEAIGRSRSAVTNLVRLLELGDTAKRLVQEGKLEMGHARALLAFSDKAAQAEAAALIARKGLSVRDTERLVKRLLADAGKGSKSEDVLDPDIRALRDDLSERLGARVTIQHGAKGGGKLVIGYNSLDELDGILAHIK
jgi:ParB family chromosome partitioning protein